MPQTLPEHVYGHLRLYSDAWERGGQSIVIDRSAIDYMSNQYSNYLHFSCSFSVIYSYLTYSCYAPSFFPVVILYISMLYYSFLLLFIGYVSWYSLSLIPYFFFICVLTLAFNFNADKYYEYCIARTSSSQGKTDFSFFTNFYF